MASLIVDGLRARVAERGDQLKQMGTLPLVFGASDLACAWWLDATAECVWMTGASPRVDGIRPCRSWLRDGAEALVLLTALTQIDFGAFQTVIQSMWRPDVTPDETVEIYTEGTVVLGYAYYIYTSDDLAPICERVVGVHAPTEAFLQDYAWLSSMQDQVQGPVRSIPVRVYIELASRQVDEMTRSLGQILHAVCTQRLHAQIPMIDTVARATARSRFEIVEVYVEEEFHTAANGASLEYLAKLTELGIRVPRLPEISDPDTSTAQRLSLVQSLHVLLLSRQTQSEQCVESVRATDAMPFAFMPAFFSAVQVSQHLNSVDVNVRSYPDPNYPEGYAALQVNITLWKWMAHALFGLDATHNVATVKLHVDYFDQQSLSAIEEVLLAEKPLDVLFHASSEPNHWLTATRFYIEDPNDLTATDNTTLFCASEPIRVQVLDTSQRQDTTCWRVYLPGCGEAWVQHADAMDVQPTEGGLPCTHVCERPRAGRGLHLELEGVLTHNMSTVLSLLRIVARDVCSLDIAMVEVQDDEFDMTDWLLELAWRFPNLKKFDFPWYAQIKSFSSLAKAAEAGDSHLRSVAFRHSACTDSTDLIDLIDVLCDAAHPLTRQLEEFIFAVEVPDVPTRDFNDAWQRLLERNRTLHTITLYHYGVQRVQTEERPVAVRSGPLCVSSKVAFLSLVQDTKSGNRARTRLDTAVIAIVFAFAAEHRDRTVEIEFQMPEDELERGQQPVA